ncbi:MAG: PAS domain-containing protein [Bilophila wadsworthia]
MDSASIPLWSTDLETGLISYNEHVCRMLGWPEGVLHMTLPDFLLRCHPDDVEHVRNVFESFSAEDAGGTEYEYRVRDGNGTGGGYGQRAKAINPLTHKAERVGIVTTTTPANKGARTLQRAAELEAQQTRTADSRPAMPNCSKASRKPWKPPVRASSSP